MRNSYSKPGISGTCSTRHSAAAGIGHTYVCSAVPDALSSPSRNQDLWFPLDHVSTYNNKWGSLAPAFMEMTTRGFVRVTKPHLSKLNTVLAAT